MADDSNSNSNTQTERFRSSCCLSTSRAIDALETGKPGDFISLAEMETKVGRPCGSRMLGRGNVTSAMRRVLREKGLVWQWDRTRKGWRCLRDQEKPTAAQSEIKRARRRAVKSQHISASVDVSKLDENQRREHTLNVALAGVMIQAGGAPVRKRLEGKLQANGGLTEPSLDKIESVFSR